MNNIFISHTIRLSEHELFSETLCESTDQPQSILQRNIYTFYISPTQDVALYKPYLKWHGSTEVGSSG